MTRRATPPVRANAFDVIVRGEGIAALLAATDCARVGLRVALISSDWPDFAREAATVPTSEARLFASAWGGVVESLCAELDVEFRIERSTPGGESILGIPGSPLSTPIRRVLGNGGAARAYADRLRPLLSIGEEFNLAALVGSRLGNATLEKLVRPAVRAELACAPEDVDLRDVAPGLVKAMSRVGSLSLGVLEMAAQDSSTIARVFPAGGLRALELSAERHAEFFAVHCSPVKRLSAHRELNLGKPVYSQALHVGVPRAREEARELWRSILSEPDYTPIGPVDLEQ